MINQRIMHQNLKVLIVGDDDDFIKDLTMVLREESCDVSTAIDGKSSLEMIRTLRPDIILLDEILTDIHGSELCRIIKSDPAIGNIIVMLLSGSDQCSECQADGQLEKDIPAWKLSARLKICIRNRQLEKALQKSEEWFRLSQDLSPDGFTILHPVRNEKNEVVDFTWVYENQTIAKINGTDPEEVIGKRILDLFPTHYGTKVFDAYIQAATTGNAQIIEEVNVGEIISRPTWLRLVIVPTSHDIVILTQNITERKESEKLLRLGETKFRAILDASPVPIALNDEKQKITYLNSSFIKTFGYDLNDIPDLTSWWPLAYPDPEYRRWVADIWQERFDKTKQEKSPFEAIELKIHCKDGTVKTVLVEAVILEGLNESVHLVSLFDITERKRAEESLQQASDIIKNMQIGQYVYELENPEDDRSLRLVAANPASGKLSGVAPEEQIGKYIDEIFPALRKMEIPQRFAEVVLTGDAGEFEDLYYSEDQVLEAAYAVKAFPLPNKRVGITFDNITGRKRTEDEIIKAKENAEINERKLKEALEIGKMGSWELDIRSGIFTFTDNFYKIFHTTAREMEGYQMRIEDYAGRFVHPEDALMVAAETQLAIESNDPAFSKTLEHRILYRDGGVGYISVRFFIVKDEFGNTIKTYGVNQDITEKKISEAELIKAKETAEASQQKFKAIADTSPLAIYISKGIRQVAEYINPTFFKLFGYRYEEVSEVALWWPLAYPDIDYQKKVSEEWNKKVENAIINKTDIEPMEVLVTCKDRSKKNILWGFVSTGDENWAFGMDLTAFRKTEEELITAKEKAEESREKIEIQNQEILFNSERLESLLNVSQLQTNSIQELLDFALSQAVSLTKSKIGYIYFYVEEKKQFILNTWSKDVMKECTVIDPQTIYELDKTGCWGEAVRQRKPIILNDYQADNPMKKGTPEGHVKLEKFLTIPVIFDNKIVAVAGVANKLTDYNSSDIRQLTLLMDNVWKISERISLIKDLQSAKEKAEESDRLKSAFLANMSHEIRTPMNGILGFAELLKEQDLTGEEQSKYIGIIEKSGYRMLNIINDIIDISKIEAGMVEMRRVETNIYEQIEYVYSFFKPEAEAKGLKLSMVNVQIKKDETLLMDREKLYAVLTNLVKNATKYTEKGEIEIGCVNKDHFFEFYVKDTGIGIPDGRQQAIFERFIQADIEDKMARQGAGLGLAITKAYVEIMGGRIWLESKEGTGSIFYFTVPFDVKNMPKSESQVNVAEKDSEAETSQLVIMIVEDDNASEILLERNLKRLVKKIITAGTGREAVELARKHHDLDLILMDIRLPEMDGYEATRKIREFNKDVVIIAQTAFGLAGDREKAIASGCNDYLSKPINKEELKRLMYLALAER